MERLPFLLGVNDTRQAEPAATPGRKRSGSGVLLLACCALAFSRSLIAAPADDIKALLEKGNAAAAYELGKKHPELLGDPTFDFHFGVAAIDSGHAGEGVLALERYSVNFPDNLNARLELARGYFVLGDDVRASQEFDSVLRANPPPAVQANIQRFLDAIRSRESRYKAASGFFLEMGLGVDSNVNGGVERASVSLPVFGDVTLAPAGVRTGDRFTRFAAGGNISHPVAPGVAVFGSANFDTRLHRGAFESQFDQRNIGAAGGLTYLKEKNFYRATFSYSTLSVDNARFRNVGGVAGEWQHQLDELQSVNGSAQYADLGYAGDNRVRNSNFYGIGAGYHRAFIREWQPLLSASLNLAKESNDNKLGEKRDDLSRDIYGLRVALSATPVPQWALSAGGTYQTSRYVARDQLLLVARKDNYYALDIAASYAFTRNLSLRGELLFSKNNSNLALFDHKRNTLALNLRYDFR